MNNLDNGMVCHSENIFHGHASTSNFCLARCPRSHALFPCIRLNTLVQGPSSMLFVQPGWCNDFKRASLPSVSALSRFGINGINGESCNDMHFRWLTWFQFVGSDKFISWYIELFDSFDLIFLVSFSLFSLIFKSLKICDNFFSFFSFALNWR